MLNIFEVVSLILWCDNYHKIVVFDYVCQNFGLCDVCGQIPESKQTLYLSYLVIFQLIFPQLIYMSIERKIANLAKANVEVLFKKNSMS